jgi:hypothetical protein
VVEKFVLGFAIVCLQGGIENRLEVGGGGGRGRGSHDAMSIGWVDGCSYCVVYDADIDISNSA